jgi:DNA-binding PadR family transcriptional regulator
MARINKTPYAILAFLAKRSMSGYDIKAHAEKISRLYWSESNAQIYPALKQLEEQGCVSSQIDPKSGKRQRRIYSITDIGKKQLMDWMLASSQMPLPREEFLLKFSNGYLLDNVTLIAQLNDYKKLLLTEQQFYEQTLRHVNDEHVNSASKRFIFFNLDYTRRILEAKLMWVDATVAELEQSGAHTV